MSLRALTWAMEHDGCPSSSTKLVLLAFANFANEQHWAYPSTETVARLTKLDPKTVRAATDALEAAGIIVDTGKRAGRTRQVKVYLLTLESRPKSDTLPKASETGRLSDRKAPNFSDKGPQNRVAEPVSEPLPPSEPDGSDAPSGGDEPAAPKADRVRGSRIPNGWQPPAAADLPPQARELARQWPAGAYAAEAEAFACYWAGEGGAKARKVDWGKTWANWVVSVTSRVLRAGKAGVKHGTQTAVASGGGTVHVPLVFKGEEGSQSAEIHAHLRAAVGTYLYQRWIEPAAIVVDSGAVEVRAATAFGASWLRQNHESDFRRGAEAVLKGQFREVRFTAAAADQVSGGRGDDGQGDGVEGGEARGDGGRPPGYRASGHREGASAAV